ncbi:MAG: hypothetical protein IAG13_17930 [Deltaproteobacteria bacterium]|nr:hypothetical protein [Nannocystaceae bacterium]
MTGLITAAVWAWLASAPTDAAAPAERGTAVTTNRTNVGEAKRLYSIGEQAMGKGRATEAVALWKRAILLLPATKDYDDLRHRLVLRLGYGMMLASESSGQRAYAVDAAQMLDRYAARHEELFGDGEKAEQQRAEVYELLYEVETKLEATRGKPDADAPPEVAATTPDEGAPELEQRKVSVPGKRKLARPSVDDPQVRARLNSRATNVETGLVMAAPGFQKLHPARGLVRMHGLARPIGSSNGSADLQSIARAAFVSVRPALRTCFAQAFARTPTEYVDTQAELVVEPDGSVSAAEIVGSNVVDAAGSKCVRERLADASIEGGAPSERVRVRVPLLFYWEDARLIDEANGQTGRDMEFLFRKREMNYGLDSPMPSIEGGDFRTSQSLTW